MWKNVINPSFGYPLPCLHWEYFRMHWHKFSELKKMFDGVVHLGYPIYFMSILGTWKILGIIAIVLPKLPLLKEWAYAGFFFAMTGAVISHIVTGDSFTQFIAPLIFAILTVISWYLDLKAKNLFIQTSKLK